jgi:LacI family transcriptional regulator
LLDFVNKACFNGDETGNVTGNNTGNSTDKTYMAIRKSSVTIQDVAREAGVSVSTVSRVINDRVDVSQETREQVLSVIGELGYTSSLAARSMRSHRNNLIGLVVPDIGFPYSIEIMKGINRAIAESSFDLLLYTTGDIQKNESALHEQHYVSLLSNSITDGVIIVASAAESFITNSPIIAVDPHHIDPDYPSVQGTNYQGTVEAMNYLIGLGHKRIAFISGREEIGSARRREEGYRDTIQKAGLLLDESIIMPGDFTTQTGYQQALKLLKREDRPSAIFASNDQSALGVFQAAEELGLRIPEDVSLIGFDNIYEAKFMGLTTVDQNLSEMGYTATQMLIKQVNNEPVDVKTYKVRTKLIIRNSCQAIQSP